MRSRRPRSVTILAWGVLILTSVHFVRTIAGLNLPPLPFSVPAWYFPVTGALWGMVGAITAYGLLRGRTWAPNLLRAAGVGYAIWFWLDRWLLVQAEYAAARSLSALLGTLLGLGIIFFFTGRPESESFFTEADQ